MKKRTRLSVNAVTPKTKELKKYLMMLKSEPEDKAIEVLSAITKEASKEEKALLHLQLLFHLPFQDELESLLEDPGDFAYITPPFSSNVMVVPTEVYCGVVLRGGLLHHFLQMVLCLQGKEFLENLTAGVVDQILDEDGYQDLFPFVLFVLAKLSRREKSGSFYLELLQTSLDGYLKADSCLKSEKFCTLVRIAGVVCMQPEDYNAHVNGSELNELLEEWDFDLSFQPGSVTKTYVGDLHENIGCLKEPVRMEVLKAIQKAVLKLDVAAEATEWKNSQKNRRITWSEFIGVHAFLAKSIWKKYGIEQKAVKQLWEILNLWADSRPKLTSTDFESDIDSFSNFCTIVKRFGDKERDRAALLPKFMEFSYDEIYLKKEGLRIAEKYLLKQGDFETVMAYILRALDKEKMPKECEGSILGPVKIIIHKFFDQNAETRERKTELVPKIFPNGSHAELGLSEFYFHINSLCAKIGMIEAEKNSNNMEVNRSNVFCTCMQNPTRAVEALMKSCVSSQHFTALEYARPFLGIRSNTNDKSASVRNVAFEKIIDNADDHDQIFESLALSVTPLVTLDLMDPKEMFYILSKKITSMFGTATPKLKKISHLYSLLKGLASALIAENNSEHDALLKEIRQFSVNSAQLSFQFLPQQDTKEILAIRANAGNIAKLIKDAGQDTVNPFSGAKLTEELSKLNLQQIGSLFIRIPSVRSEIVKIIHEESSGGQSEKLSLPNLVSSVVTWVHDTDAEGYSTVIELLQLLQNPVIDASEFANRTLHYSWDAYIAVNCQPSFRQYLKFHHKWIKYLLKNQALLEDSKRQFKVCQSIVGLASRVSKSMRLRKKPGDRTAIDQSIQQVFLLLLEVLNDIISQNEQFDTDLKEDLLDLITELPLVKGTCEPIRKCVVDRILYCGDNNYLPMSSVENSNSASIELDIAAQMQNLPVSK